MSSIAPSYLIIGAGLFGASGALELRKRLPSSNVTMVDNSPFPNQSAATCDLNKIIRADYPDVFYMQLSLEAQDGWRNDPLFKPFYHEPGMLYAESKGMGRDFLRKYEQIGVKPASEIITVDEARSRWRGVFRDAMWDGVSECYFNPRSGWGEGEAALRGLVQAAIDQGAAFVTGSCTSLIIGQDGTCSGVELSDGRKLEADHVVVAAGAWTPLLLAKSAPADESVQVGDRMIAAGAIQCRATFPDSEAEKLSEAPVIFNAMKHTEGKAQRESIPPTKDGRMKFNYEVSFTNKCRLSEDSDQIISVPPARKSQSTWSDDVPQKLKEEIEKVMRHTYGEHISGLHIESYRMCWDAVTPSQDWIISPHPHCKGLYIAGGGSFHSWKFMPTIGQYIAKMLLGELDEEHANRWAWDRPDGGKHGALPEYIPHRDLQDIYEKNGTQV